MRNDRKFIELPHWRQVTAVIMVLCIALPFYAPFIIIGYLFAYTSRIGVKYVCFLAAGFLAITIFSDYKSEALGLIFNSSIEFWFLVMFKNNPDFSSLTNVYSSIEVKPLPLIGELYVSGITNPKYLMLFISLGGAIGALLSVWSYLARCDPLKKIEKPEVDIKVGTMLEMKHHLNNMKPASVVGGTLLGTRLDGKQAILTDKNANMHSLILGSSGSGKTVSMANIVESSILRDFPTFIIDGKGSIDLGKQIQRFAEDQGKKCYFLSFGHPDSNCVYDPFYCGNYTAKKDRIIGLREWESEHYEKLSAGFMQIVFKVLETLDIYPDLKTLSAYMSKIQLVKLIKERGLSDSISAEEKAKCEMLLQEVTAMNIDEKDISSLVREIKNLADSSIGEDFFCLGQESKPPLRLSDVYKEKAVVYIGLPVFSALETSSLIGKLIINDLKAAIEDRQRANAKDKSYIFFDEFSIFSGRQVLNLVNMARGYGAHCVFSTQTLADISAGSNKGAELVQQFIGNCRNYILHSGLTSDDASVLADQIGTKSKVTYTAQIGATGTTGLGSAREGREYLVHPDKLKALDTGEACFFVKSEGAAFIKARHSPIDRDLEKVEER